MDAVKVLNDVRWVTTRPLTTARMGGRSERPLTKSEWDARLPDDVSDAFSGTGLWLLHHCAGQANGHVFGSCVNIPADATVRTILKAVSKMTHKTGKSRILDHVVGS